jgi:phosphotransferase system  glucose/maltose/N-acetylglucosamine-specific IIC component
MEEAVGLLLWFVRTLIIEILFYTIFYWIGWAVCKVFTLGKYPQSMPSSNDKKKSTLVFLVGMAVSIIIFMAFIYWS